MKDARLPLLMAQLWQVQGESGNQPHSIRLPAGCLQANDAEFSPVVTHRLPCFHTFLLLFRVECVFSTQRGQLALDLSKKASTPPISRKLSQACGHTLRCV